MIVCCERCSAENLKFSHELDCHLVCERVGAEHARVHSDDAYTYQQDIQTKMANSDGTVGEDGEDDRLESSLFADDEVVTL